jgi:hypothetical protein
MCGFGLFLKNMIAMPRKAKAKAPFIQETRERERECKSI